MQACTVISKKEKAIEWRPHAHHILHTKDAHFDSRFNAFLKCEVHLKELYQSVIQKHHEDLVDKLFNEVQQFRAKPVVEQVAAVSMTCVASSLSNPDLEGVVDLITDSLSSRTEGIVLNARCNNVTSAHDILCEVADNLRVLTEQKAKSEKRVASISTTGAKVSGGLSRMVSEMPSQALLDLLHSSDSGKRCLLLVMVNVEKVDDEVFSDFLEMVHGIAGFSVQIFTINSSVCPLPLRLSKSAQVLVNASVTSAATNWEIYDNFIGKVVSSKQLPVVLTSDAWTWIHDTFWRSSCCVRSALDMILLSLQHHFARRSSLLAMYEDTQWLTEMKLVKKTGKTREEKEHGAIHDILGYLGNEDVRDAGIINTTEAISWNEQVLFAKRKLQSNISRMQIDKAWFECLCKARDFFLAYHNDGKRSEFCSDILWASVTSTSQYLSSNVNDLIDAIEKYMTRVPIRSICLLIEICTECFDTVGTKLQNIYDSGSPQDNLGDLPGVASGASWLAAKAIIVQECESLKNGLEDHMHIFGETTTIMQSQGIPSHACQAELPMSLGSAKRKSLPIVVSELDRSTCPPISDVENTAAAALSFRSPVKNRSSKAFDSQHEADMLKPANVDLFNCSSPVAPQSGSRLTSMQSPDGSGTLFGESLSAFTRIAIEDFIRWLRSASTLLRKIPRPDPIPGVLDITEEDVKSTLAAADGSVRSKYLDVLSNSSNHISDQKGTPDVATLAQIVFKSVSTASIFDWFDAFKSASGVWEPPVASKKRKRDSSANELSEQSILKCRFVKALADLETFGIVKIKNGGMEVSRTSYVWMS